MEFPKIWYLEFKTKEQFIELCSPYKPDYIFYEGIGITNNLTNISLGDYYYLERGKKRFGEEITYKQFKQFTTKKVDISYLKNLFKKLNIK